MTVVQDDPDYDLFTKPRVKIKSSDGSETFYTYDSFDEGSSNINIVSVDAENNTTETSVFNIVVEDYENNIEFDKLNHSKVFLEFGKKSWINSF
ncbi:MAG: hypothetical protein ACPKPY_12860 [Nitrososphaeraceae archaeon]